VNNCAGCATGHWRQPPQAVALFRFRFKSYHAFQNKTQGRARCPAKPTVCVQSLVGGGGLLLALEEGAGHGALIPRLLAAQLRVTATAAPRLRTVPVAQVAKLVSLIYEF
jgi:hypothetical protein